jgi:hypothetical protein
MKSTSPAYLMPLLLLFCSITSWSKESARHSLPIVILEHRDGTENWGRVVAISDDSLIIRRIEDFQPMLVNQTDVVKVYQVRRKSSSLPLSILAGAMVMGGTWAAVTAVGNGEVSTESGILAVTIGAIPSVFAGVEVSNLTKRFRIEPMDVLGPQGTLDLPRMRALLEQRQSLSQSP